MVNLLIFCPLIAWQYSLKSCNLPNYFFSDLRRGFFPFLRHLSGIPYFARYGIPGSVVMNAFGHDMKSAFGGECFPAIKYFAKKNGKACRIFGGRVLYIKKGKRMTFCKEDIKTRICLAKTVDRAIREYKSFNAEAAYRKCWKRLKRHAFASCLLRTAAVLLLPFVVSTAVFLRLYLRQSQQTGIVSYQEVSSAPGLVSEVLLPDSSRVWLNAGSSLGFPSRFDGEERNVRLCGEAYFEVRADKAHPFYVSLDNELKVKVVGTKFNVSAYQGDRYMEVTLATGSVEVLSGSRVLPLKPDEAFRYDRDSRRMTVRSVDADEKTAWKEGRLVFRDAPLEEVVRKLSRKYNVDIVLHRESAKDYRFRATFSSENVTQILDYLKMAAPVRWSFADAGCQAGEVCPRRRIDVWLK